MRLVLGMGVGLTGACALLMGGGGEEGGGRGGGVPDSREDSLLCNCNIYISVLI